ncbi:DEAD/DEAH box helicase [Sulfolobus acidocaldarius]|uniref:DEAD box helicase n=4 Tax=Sulfolobus acidocaldarius TaxID=2285 RepID=Q4JBY2_SULAC|nr:DEAD/DEAH box helicase [Sulfolobus acidocaldarius]AAY79697.1 DEAD box helicase [Sulfolobus acidocaldarius DSM 639]AGE70256.1 DEAD box helicase [Sulfolobus acidocaldarius N8]AGE72531.1 DEAD box helicase [Sulfolobus acidocaldarius Ron12/I]ALU29341.1 DEAD/DEAH box helicase [Sulfolobus acidocaldarius]ALU32070.1 DEAD/DEAH box helicase [Sulfolobus acidocaldarius]
MSTELIDRVSERLSYFNVKIAHIFTETALEPDLGAKVEDLPLGGNLKQMLKQVGIHRLYKFQEEAYNKISHGNNVMIVSGTGTGKTEAFLIPLLDLALKGERSVLVYPTKALARDQLERVRRLASPLGVEMGVFDGDTPEKERKRLYENPPHILITNPDMIHIGLPLSYRFRRLIRTADHFVFDEVHSYDGVLGSHIRMISDRLRELTDYHVIGSSATIDASPYLFEELFGVKGEIIYGSPRRKGVAIHALLNIGSASRWTLSAYLTAFLVKEGYKVLTFVDSQQMAELIAKITARFGEENIHVHRAGINKEDRLKVEESIKSGKIKGVIATPTLELGIDIGDLDVVIMAENPPNYTKYLQRAGRAGRRSKIGYIFTLLGEDPIDTYYLRKPTEFFNRKVLPLTFDVSNKEVVKIHAAAYLAEKGSLRLGRVIPKAWVKAYEELVKDGKVKIENNVVSALPPLYSYVRSTYLRSTGPIVGLYDRDGNRLGERELPVALYDIYPQAIYFISKRNYIVEDVKLDSLRATLRRAKDDLSYYTKPVYSTHLLSFEEIEERKVFGLPVKYGISEIMISVDGFATYEISGNKNKPKQEFFYKEPIIFTYTTKGVLIKHPILEEFNEFDSIEAYHATEHVLISSARVVAGASMTDLAGISYPTGHVVIYDSVVGGSGVSKLLYDRLEEAYDISIDITGKCDCEDGCPKCIYSPYCGNNNKMLSRRKSHRLMTKIKLGEFDNSVEQNINGKPIV